MPSNYDRVANTTDSFTTGTLTGVVAGADHGSKADALNKIQAQVVKESPLNVNWPGYGGNIATAIAALPASGACLYIPAGKYTGAFDFASKDHLTVLGDGSTSVIHNTTASDHALSFTDCDDLTVENIRVQGTSGTFDGLHLERCFRGSVKRVFCQGSGRNGIYAEECIGITVDDCVVGIDSTSPYPTSVANCTGGLKLTWDTVNADSGCNQFVINGGFYVIGKDRGWAIEVDHADGGLINGPIPELSKGGIFLNTCWQLVVNGYYGEANPSDVEYTTGTCSTTASNTAVTGSGTAWNTNDGEGNKNAMVGKWLIIGTKWAQIGSIGTNTAVTLASNWPGSTASGQAYRMQSVDLYMKSCIDCAVNAGRGGGAVLLEGSSRNVLNLLTESVFFDAASHLNTGRITTNRASSTTTRLVDNGTKNRVHQFNYQTNADVRVDGLYRVGATEMRTDDTVTTSLAVYANVGAANQIALYTDGKIYWHTSADTSLHRVQSAVVGVGNSLNFPTAVTAASVPNNTIFRDSADNVIKKKDNTGAVTAI